MKKTIQLADKIEISLQTSEAEGTLITRLETIAEQACSKTSGVSVIAYRVEPGATTTVALPEVEIKVEFPLFGVVRIMPPCDFGASSRVGMWYDSTWQSRAVGFEPFALFVGSGGECKYLVGLSRLDVSSWVRAHVYGGAAEAMPSGVKGIGAFHVKRSSVEHNHFKGRGGAAFEDAIYVDTAGGDAYAAVQRYFTWLRENYYSQSPDIPEGADEVLWHSWYAHQAVITQDIIRKQAALARELDIRRVQIDAFWDVPSTCDSIWGSNIADPGRFPDFPALVKELHANGQRVALHVNPFGVDPFRFTDQKALIPLLSAREGKPAKGGCGDYELCPRCPETRDYILSWVRRLVGEYGIDEIWYDFVDGAEGLYAECDNPEHRHLPGTPGDHVVAILREMLQEARKINPKATMWGRREQANPITRQWESNLMPHDRYLDYLGNLRECLLLHQLAHHQRVQFVCTNWPVGGEDPAVVARHMISSIFAGVPAISVDLSRQSPAILEVIRKHVALYRANKAWLNEAPRRLLCPEDAIRAIALDGPDSCWILCTGTPPGLITVPDRVREIRLFSSTFEEMATVLAVKGRWRAIRLDYSFQETGEVLLEYLQEGVFVRAKGNPLFGVKLERA